MSVSAGDRWASGAAYEGYIGRWSRLVAPEFVDWLAQPAGLRWLDVGCGTGILTRTILERSDPASVVGIDPAQPFVDHAREAVADARVTFRVGSADSTGAMTPPSTRWWPASSSTSCRISAPRWRRRCGSCVAAGSSQATCGTTPAAWNSCAGSSTPRSRWIPGCAPGRGRPLPDHPGGQARRGVRSGRSRRGRPPADRRADGLPRLRRPVEPVHARYRPGARTSSRSTSRPGRRCATASGVADRGAGRIDPAHGARLGGAGPAGRLPKQGRSAHPSGDKWPSDPHRCGVRSRIPPGPEGGVMKARFSRRAFIKLGAAGGAALFLPWRFGPAMAVPRFRARHSLRGRSRST